MSYVQRLINLTINLNPSQANPNPTFEGTNANTLKITSPVGSGDNAITALRISVSAVKAGGRGASTAQVTIYGLPLSIMNQLSTLGVVAPMFVGKNNSITVEAGDAENGVGVMYQGNITAAWANMDQPEVSFNITAFVGAYAAASPAPVTSFPRSFDVATGLASLATVANYNFVNNGVSQRLPPSYYSGSIQNQINKMLEDAGLTSSSIIDNNTLTIWPVGGSRGGLIPLIGPNHGMVGYPKYTSTGIALRSLYNPSVSYGSQIKVESELTPATGIWFVSKLTYNLECQTPDGDWFCDIEASRPGFTVVPQ